ncbi:MAG: tRNA (adenosine(37)-N6)-threonylcarbamoyltransferase complex ATPase subunit type 1 TsaE [Thermodesulfobacteriota bacterium]
MATLRLPLAGAADTARLGAALAALVRPGDLVALKGDLGAGKTCLTQHLGAALGVPASCPITSPTFAIIHEYPGRLPLVHIDLYRLESEAAIVATGVPDYLNSTAVVVVEWSERLGSLLPPERLEIELRYQEGGGRQAILTAQGHDWPERLTRLAQALEAG